MSGETEQHRKLKEVMRKKLENWFGASIVEYPSSGHELDVFSVSPKGIKLMVEIMWTPTPTNFYRDLSLLLQSDAKIKVLVVNKSIFSNPKLVREFQKARISEITKGCKVSNMLDGNRILEDENYVESEMYEHLKALIDESEISIEVEIEEISRQLLLKGTKLSPIIAKCLGISKSVDANDEYISWLRNELYGYSEFLNHASGEILEPSDLPNNPQYRKVLGKIKFTYRNSETGKFGLEQVDKPVMFTHPVAELEDMIENMKDAKEFYVSFPKEYFPKVDLEVSSIPVIIKTSALSTCLQQLRLRLHKYLNEELLSSIKS